MTEGEAQVLRLAGTLQQHHRFRAVKMSNGLTKHKLVTDLPKGAFATAALRQDACQAMEPQLLAAASVTAAKTARAEQDLLDFKRRYKL